MFKRIIPVALIIALVAAAPVMAVERSSYPGIMGVKRWAAQHDPVMVSGAIGNPSETRWLAVDLPIVNHPNYRYKYGHVTVIDMNYNSSVKVNLNGIYRSGCSWYGFASPSWKSSGTGCGLQYAYFYTRNINYNANCFYRCSIPPKYNGNASFVVSYTFNEY